MIRLSRREGLRLAFALVIVAGCRLPTVALDPRPACAGEVCVQLREELAVSWVIAADLQAPAATVLRNARARDVSTTGGPCKAGVPVAAVVFDGVLVQEGPLSVAGAHRLELQFPQAPEAASDRAFLAPQERFVELDLEVGGQSRCLRAPVKKKDAP